ncbi:MAG: LysR family transcriptional regulator [Sandaracinaceae bacterium]
MSLSDPTELSALVALLETRSVSVAARRLGLSQPAMSHRLRQLREALGDPLLVAAPGGYVLTPRAEALEEPLRAALANVRAALRAGEGFDAATSRRHFVVANADYGDFVAFPAAVERVRREAPHVTFETTSDSDDLATRLASGAVDVAVTEAGRFAPSLRQRRVASLPYAVGLRAGHEARAGNAPLDLDAYCHLGHAVVAPHGNPGTVVDQRLGELGRTRHIVVRTPRFTPLPFLVAASDLVATLPEPLLRAAARYVDLEILPPPIVLPSTVIMMVWHERMQQDEGHTWFRNVVADSLG